MSIGDDVEGEMGRLYDEMLEIQVRDIQQDFVEVEKAIAEIVKVQGEIANELEGLARDLGQGYMGREDCCRQLMEIVGILRGTKGLGR